jgi:acetyl-CoA carboxylase biotin carboxyl carrier protein
VKLGGKLGARQPPLAPDPEVIRALAGLLAETGLTEIEYAVGDHRIRVAREAAGKAPPATNGHAPHPTGDPAAASEKPATNGAAPPGTLTSPIVGVAYLAPEPGAAPFVRAGDTVSEGQTLLIIEAMKTFNPIKAPKAGTLAQVLIDNAHPVEFGQPLMIIE